MPRAKASKAIGGEGQALQDEKNAASGWKGGQGKDHQELSRSATTWTFFAAGSCQRQGGDVAHRTPANSPITIKANEDGPYWKKGESIPANKNKGFISIRTHQNRKACRRTAAELESKKKAEVLSKANAAAPPKATLSRTAAKLCTEARGSTVRLDRC